MNILFMSNEAAGYCIAHKLAQEDNQVYFYAKDFKHRITGIGIKNPLEIPDWKLYVDKADLIIFDTVSMGRLADTLSRSGKKVIGASEFADKIELDRTFGMELVDKYTDAQASEFKEFKTLDEGIKFLKDKEESYVFKPLNNKFTKWTYVPRRNNEELLYFMENFKKLHGNSNEFVLQAKVEGIEISTEGWFDWRRGWLKPFNHTIESKRFMEGDKAEQTGCMGNIVWIVNEDDRIVNSILLPLTDILEKNKYIGCIDANCIVDEDNIWFLEWTSRFGYSAIQALLRLYEGSITAFMNAIVDEGEFNFKEEFGIAVRISLPPFPRKFSNENSKELQGVRAFYYPEEYQDNIWLSDIMFKDNIPVVAGLDGHVCDVTETGKTIDECREKVYKIIEDIIIPMDIQYRSDIGEGVKEKIEALKL